MSVNLYSVEQLLVGHWYRSRSVEGEIVEAQKDERCVWYDNAESYLVRIRVGVGNYKWRTLAVSNHN
jgi:hypothetical protein